MAGPPKWLPIVACMTTASVWLTWSNARPPRAVPPALVPGLRHAAEPTELQRPRTTSALNLQPTDHAEPSQGHWGIGDAPHSSDRRMMDTGTHPAILVPSPAIPMEEYGPDTETQDEETR